MIAFHHPTRRWLVELLGVEGPTTVGQLSERTGLAVGSISHHLKALHKRGFISPAPELARDTRESWWRATPRELTWNADDFPPGTVGRRLADAAELENFRHQVRAVQTWMTSRNRSDEAWRRSATSTDIMVSATAEELADLGSRLTEVIAAWSADCLAGKATEQGGSERRPVRVIARVFPSGPVRP